MYLRDMQLDVPYPASARLDIINKFMSAYNCTYEHALRIDYDRNWKTPIRRRFLLETNCTVSMFLRILGKYKNIDTKKIVVNCVDTLSGKGGTVLGICKIEQIVDYNGFFLQDDYEKKRLTLNVIKQTIAKVAKDKEWNTSPFEEVYAEMIKLQYNNHWTWRKKIKNQNRLYTAEVYLEHEIKDIKIYIIIRDKQGDIVKKQLVISELPDEYAYVKHLGKLTWLSNSEVQLVNKNSTEQWNVQLDL
ncbi:hypothetical protein HZI73_17585 [Vallitalea pronyensis]|uniref:Uncharacterized protein n=1 Tax=Vallitalea pronyensis TaxID=1348613 RepID=A0A8J8SI19_9FIRM|nr:hypothetical protein [Vallitalea pronyensis]QUI23997.1 hypothetical protein HZI73_17585 [Vallitalea pronyensis]